ncbi:MAG: peptidoglycan-binding protein [Clostridia bacterium]|nr:peptidoglycan-binding protein [Clostridia bacterium]
MLLLFVFFYFFFCLNTATQGKEINCFIEKKQSCCQEDFPELCRHKQDKQNIAIQELQQILLSLGYYKGEITGLYDERTITAVSSFQKEAGLAVDGEVKYHVWLKLAQATENKVMRKKTPPPSGEICLVIDTFRRRLMVMNDHKLYAQFPVAIGKTHTPSPLGNWKIINKGFNWGTGFGTRWLGLNVPWGVYGIHGTNKPWSIGSMASHGCFRMLNKDVETIFPWIKNGTPVIVVGNPFGYMSGGIQRLNVGDKCAAITVIQEKLWRKGFYKGKADGIYGPATEKAVKELQKIYSLQKTGQVGYQEYEVLGIVNTK